MRDHDELLRRYLLGKLETEEQKLLDERLLREEDLLEMAEAVKADLLDDYDQGRLAPDEREHAHLLASSPQGRRSLTVMRGIGKINDNVLVFPDRGNRRNLSRFERAAAMAAMLTIAVLGTWLAVQTPEQVQPPQVAAVPAPALPSPAPGRPLSPPAATPLPPQDVIAEIEAPETPAPRLVAPLVLELALSTYRGEETIPQKNVPPGTERVHLHLLLDEADQASFASFQAVVRGAGPERRYAGLEPSKTGGTWTLVLDLDPKIREGMYEVEVWGVTDSGSLEEVALKELEIQRNASADAGTPD